MTFPCGQCTEIFNSKGQLKEHAKAHRVSFVCDLCETEPFGGQGSLHDHKSVTHGVLIECPCGKSFTRVDNLIRHVKGCTKVGPSLRCECGLALQRMDEFKEHQEGICAHPLEEGPGQIVAPFVGAGVGDARNYIEGHFTSR